MKVLLLLTAIILTIALERSQRYGLLKRPFFRDYFTTDLLYLVIAIAFGIAVAALYLDPLSLWLKAHTTWPRIARIDLPLYVSAPLALLLLDFGNYLCHYALHRYDTLWEFHKVHHSAHTVDWLATFRSHALEQVLRNVLGPVFLLLIGFDIPSMAIASALYAAFAVFNHSNTKLNLRRLEPFFITPRLHQMHHHALGTTQKNLGTVVTLWDRAFGTYYPGQPLTALYGVPGEVDTFPQTFLPQFLEPIRRAKRKDAHAAPVSHANEA